MFERIFCKYMYENGMLNEAQFKEIMSEAGNQRVKLGIIAITEGLMTEAQAKEVNDLQSITDRRFGDIAVEKGYLTDEQVGNLLKQQGNSFLKFLQTVIDKGLYSLDELEGFLGKYQESMGFTQTDMDDLVSGDVLRAVNVFLPQKDELGSRLCGVAVRTFMRIIDPECYIGRAYLADSFKADRFAAQITAGDRKIVTGFAGDGDALLAVAVPFAKEEFDTVDLDALDAVAEFTNCIDGIYASDLSKEGIDIDMCPPEFYDSRVNIKGDGFYVVPIITQGKQIYFIMSIDSQFKIVNI